MTSFSFVLRLRGWLFVVAVVAVFSGVLVASETGGSFFDLPSELEDLIVDAAEICGGDDPWRDGCVEAAWAACLWAKRYRQETASSWQELSESQDEPNESVLVERRVRFLPHDFLCRAVHMAELARLAATLDYRYGSEFYEESTNINKGSFWWFREHITYTPWELAVEYGSFDSDVSIFGKPDPVLIGPVLAANGWSFTVGRWLNKIQDWGFVGGNSRLIFSRLSEQTVHTINSLLGSISSLTEVYDNWPVDAPYDPDYNIQYYQTPGEAKRPIMHSVTLEYKGYLPPGFPGPEESESSLRVYEICSSAITAAKIRMTGWENRLGECQKAAQDCIAISDDSEILCNRISVLAQEELNWQKLPTICQSTENKDAKEDQCELAMKEICRYKQPIFLRFLGTIAIRRYMSMRVSTCLITKGPTSPMYLA